LKLDGGVNRGGARVAKYECGELVECSKKYCATSAVP
jgi:hypothetical protein